MDHAWGGDDGASPAYQPRPSCNAAFLGVSGALTFKCDCADSFPYQALLFSASVPYQDNHKHYNVQFSYSEKDIWVKLRAHIAKMSDGGTWREDLIERAAPHA